MVRQHTSADVRAVAGRLQVRKTVPQYEFPSLLLVGLELLGQVTMDKQRLAADCIISCLRRHWLRWFSAVRLH